MDVAQAVQDGVLALRDGRPDDAATLLGRAWGDAELAAATDLVDIRARVGSLYAQALIDAGRAAEADAPCRQALRLLRSLRDKDGIAEVRKLQDRIVKALAHDAEAGARLREQRRVASTPIEGLLATATTPSERAAAYVRKANALLDVSAPEAEALALAAEGLAAAERAGDATWQVMARLALARAQPAEAATHLDAAHGVASAHDEFNLISTIARAAEIAGVLVGVHALPEHPPHVER